MKLLRVLWAAGALLLLAAAASASLSPWLALPLAWLALDGLLLLALNLLRHVLYRRRMARLARPYLVEDVLGFLTSPEGEAS